MKPVRFEGCNSELSNHDPEAKPVPVLELEEREGTVIICWKLTWRERLRVVLTGVIWNAVVTFHRPMQPVILTVKRPFNYMEGGE
jgi:hypothetical protein